MSGGEGDRGSLLQRWHAVLAGLSSGELSRVDCAVLAWVAEHAGGDLLEAWPSLATLAIVLDPEAAAADDDLERSHVSRSLRRLRALGYIEVSRPGTRAGRATRHRLTLKGVADIAARKQAAAARRRRSDEEGDDKTVTTSGDSKASTGGDIAVTTVVTNQVEGGDKTVPEGVTALSPKPPINRAGSAGDEVVVDLPSASPPAASTAAEAAGSPGGDRPTAARAPGQLEHSWFWGLYPKRQNAAAADRLLSELLAGGVSRADIEAGLRAYADDARRRHLDSKYIALPLNWLRREQWLDRPSVTEAAERDGLAQQKTPAKAPKRAKEPRSGGGKGEGATKPAKAAKAPETGPAQLAAEIEEARKWLRDTQDYDLDALPIGLEPYAAALRLVGDGHPPDYPIGGANEVDALAKRIEAAFAGDDAEGADLLRGDAWQKLKNAIVDAELQLSNASKSHEKLTEELDIVVKHHEHQKAHDIAEEIISRAGDAFAMHPEAANPNDLRDSLAELLYMVNDERGVWVERDWDPRFDKNEGRRGYLSFVGWLTGDIYAKLLELATEVGRDWPAIERRRKFEATLVDLPPHESNRRRLIHLFTVAGIDSIPEMAEIIVMGLVHLEVIRPNEVGIAATIKEALLCRAGHEDSAREMFNADPGNQMPMELMSGARAGLELRAAAKEVSQ